MGAWGVCNHEVERYVIDVIKGITLNVPFGVTACAWLDIKAIGFKASFTEGEGNGLGFFASHEYFFHDGKTH